MRWRVGKGEVLGWTLSMGRHPHFISSPNPQFAKKRRYSGLPQGWYQELAREDKQQNDITLCTNLQDRLRWDTIEFPCTTKESTEGSEPEQGPLMLCDDKEPPLSRGSPSFWTEILGKWRLNHDKLQTFYTRSDDLIISSVRTSMAEEVTTQEIV